MSNELEASRAVTSPMNGEDITGSAIAQIGKPGLCRSSAPVLCRKGHTVPLSHMAKGRGGWRGQHGDFSLSCLGSRCREPDAPACDGATRSLRAEGGLEGAEGHSCTPVSKGQPLAIVWPHQGAECDFQSFHGR